MKPADFPTIDVDGRATVEDILAALGIAGLPLGCALGLGDEVEIAVTANRIAVADELREDDELGFAGGDDLIDMVKALIAGDLAIALALIGRIFSDYGPDVQTKQRLEDLIYAQRRKTSAAEPAPAPRLAAA